MAQISSIKTYRGGITATFVAKKIQFSGSRRTGHDCLSTTNLMTAMAVTAEGNGNTAIKTGVE
jgi:hypothetical protein